jgi:dipeptidyl aminopeptidase/acylaminoacyl peptidase
MTAFARERWQHASTWHRARRADGMAARAAVIALAIVLLIPILLLFAVAMVVAGAVFLALTAWTRSAAFFRRSDREGRINVRVRDGARLLAVLLACAAPAATLRAEGVLTVEVAAGLRRVTDVALRRGGDLAAYALSVPRTADEDAGPPRSEIWVVATDGASPPRRYSAAGVESSAPKFSPDGTLIAFLSKRPGDDNPAQIHLLPVDGGEARRLTEHAAPVESFEWGPDGTSICFAARAEKDDEDEDWTVVDEPRPRAGAWRVDVATGSIDRLDDGSVHVVAIAVSPRSDVAAVVTDRPGADREMMALRLERLAGADAPPAIIAATEGKLGAIALSPSGATLAFLGATALNDPLPQSLFTVPLAGGTARHHTPGLEGSARGLVWLDDSTVLLLADEGTRSVLITLPVTGGAPRRVLEAPGAIDDVDLDRTSGCIAVALAAPDHPAEVYATVPGRGGLARLTHHNPELESLSLARAETIAWTAPDGLRIEGILIHPPAPTGASSAPAPRPLVVNPHGGPEGVSRQEWSAFAQLLAARGYLVLQPNYRGSGGRGVAFSRGDHDDLGGAEFADILAGVDLLVARGLADPARVGMAGWSYGGYLSAMAATHHSDRFGAAVMGAGISNWISFTGTTDIPREMSTVHWNRPLAGNETLYWERSPLAAMGRARTPTLILFGAGDDRVPPSQGAELHEALRARGIATEMVTYKRAGHGVRERRQVEDLYRRQLQWFDRYLADGSE